MGDYTIHGGGCCCVEGFGGGSASAEGWDIKSDRDSGKTT